MNRLSCRSLLALAVLALSASTSQAHITIAPAQSVTGATEKYTLRVPTEGKVATVAAEVDIPAGVIVETQAGAAAGPVALR